MQKESCLEDNCCGITQKISEKLDVILKRSIDDRNKESINFKRDDKLLQNTNIDLWLDYLRFELTTNDILDVIDSSVQPAQNYYQDEMMSRRYLVRDIIFNRIDEKYHKSITNKKDPVKSLSKLRENKRNDINVIDTSVRARLHSLKMERKNY